MNTSPLVDRPSREPKSIWRETIPRELQEQLLADDAKAWSAVTGVLVAIVTLGLVLGVIAVLVSG